MATIIDALVVTFGLDSSGVKKGAADVDKSLKKAGEQSEKTAQKVQHSTKSMEKGFNSAKIEIMGMLAALGVALSAKGIEGFFQRMTTGNAALGRFAANVNMTAARVKAMSVLSEEFGGTSADAMNAIQTVANGVAEAIRTGSSAFTNYARNIGAELQDSSGHWLTYEQQLVSIGKRLQVIAKSNPMGREQAYEYAQQMGLGGFFNELMDPNLSKDLNQAQSVVGVTPQTIAAAEQLQKQWALVRAQFSGFWDQLYTAVGPTLLQMSKELLKWLEGVDFKKLAKDAQRFVEGIDWKGFGQDIENLVNVIGQVKDSLGGWAPILKVVGALLAIKLVSPLLGLIGTMGTFVTGATAMTGSLTALAAGAALVAAAFGGWKIGSIISDNLSPEHSEMVGKFVTTILAALGDKDAQKTLANNRNDAVITSAMQDPNVPVAVKKAAMGKRNIGDPAVIALLAAHQQNLDASAGGVANNPDLATGAPNRFSRWLATHKAALERNNPGDLVFAGQPGATKDPDTTFAKFNSLPEGLAAQYRQLQLYMTRDNLTSIRGIVSKYAPKYDAKGKQINDTDAYIANVAKWTRHGADDILQQKDIPALMRAMNRQEGYSYGVTDADYRAALALAQYDPRGSSSPTLTSYGTAYPVDDATVLAGYGSQAPSAPRPAAAPAPVAPAPAPAAVPIPTPYGTAYPVSDAAVLAGYGATVATTPQVGVARAPTAANGAATGAPQIHIDSVTVNTRATDAQGIARDMANKVSNTPAITLSATGVE